MSGFIFDTNILLDIATADPLWLHWSESQLRAAASQGPVFINPIIYAEFAPAFPSVADLDRWLDPALFQRLPLPYTAGWLAAQAFITYRRAGGTKTSPLPDFYMHTPSSRTERGFRATLRVTARIFQLCS